MPKSKARKRPKSGRSEKLKWGGTGSKGSGRINAILAAIAAVAVAGGAILWWQSSKTASAFEDLVAQGQGQLARVETMPNHGRGHLSPGQNHSYGTTFPTSGIHDQVWTRTGFHDSPQRPTQLVHALEHGNIVIYYDDPGPEVLDTLKDWAGLFNGKWDGIVVTPMSGFGETIVLSAWTKLLRTDRFEPAASAVFIDAFRGRGPENPVR